MIVLISCDGEFGLRQSRLGKLLGWKIHVTSHVARRNMYRINTLEQINNFPDDILHQSCEGFIITLFENYRYVNLLLYGINYARPVLS